MLSGNTKPPLEYRTYVQELMASRDVNQAQLCKLLGRSKSWTSQMLSGGRPLKPGVAMRVAQALKLNERERSRLLALVELEEGESDLAREKAMSVVLALESPEPEDTLLDEKILAMSAWYMAAILELARCEGFQADPRWVAATLRPRVTVSQATEALATLKRLGLLDHNARPNPEADHLATSRTIPRGPRGAAATRYHRETTRLSMDAMREFDGTERLLVGASLGLNDDAMATFRARLEELVAQALLASQLDDTPPTRVYQFNLAVFPVSLYTDTEYDPEEIL